MIDELLEILVKHPVHTVIRWTMHRGRFTYVAIKIGNEWYTTATDLNTTVGQTVDSTELARLLGEGLVPFEVATSWKEVLL